MARRSRSAFALIELLVMLAVIAMLIGLLILAVHRVRTEAARLKSASSSEQVSRALSPDARVRDMPPRLNE